jgi:hypothetical protein
VLGLSGRSRVVVQEPAESRSVGRRDLRFGSRRYQSVHSRALMIALGMVVPSRSCIDASSRVSGTQAIGAITHRLCRLIWKILHQGIRYEERGPAVSTEAKKVRARKMIRELRSLGYRVELLAPAGSPA